MQALPALQRVSLNDSAVTLEGFRRGEEGEYAAPPRPTVWRVMLCGRACCVNIKIYAWVVAEIINLGAEEERIGITTEDTEGAEAGLRKGYWDCMWAYPPVLQKEAVSY